MSLSYFLFLQPFLQQIGRIEQGRIGVDLAEVRAQETLMHMTAVALNGDISTDLEELKKLRMSATARGIKAAEARHNKPGGTREKREEIRSVWKSGKYTTKQLCAEEEYLAIGMSYDAARKALRNMEKPT